MSTPANRSPSSCPDTLPCTRRSRAKLTLSARGDGPRRPTPRMQAAASPLRRRIGAVPSLSLLPRGAHALLLPRRGLAKQPATSESPSGELGSLMPPPAARTPAAVARSPSRVELARQRSTLGEMWENYQQTFVRTGSFMPIFHCLGALFTLQMLVWAVRGMPEDVRNQLEGNTAIRTGRQRTEDVAPNKER